MLHFRKKRKLLNERRKQRERIELKMDLPGVSIADTTDVSLFSLMTVKKQKVKPHGSASLGQIHYSILFFFFTTSVCCISLFPQVLADISKGDMQAADALAEEDDDIHLSDEDDDEADKMSLASELDEDDLEEVHIKEKELEKKATKKK